MSISLFIGYRDPRREDRLIPIASDHVFEQHWKPISAELGLRWVPRFEKGWMLASQDFPHIIDELTRLGRYLACGETHAEISHHMMARISVIVRELNEVHQNFDADAFVGSPWQAQRRAAAFQRSPYPCGPFVERRATARPSSTQTQVLPPATIERLLEKAPEPASEARVTPIVPEALASHETPLEDYHRLHELIRLVQDLKTALASSFRLQRHLSGRAVPRAWKTALEDL